MGRNGCQFRASLYDARTQKLFSDLKLIPLRLIAGAIAAATILAATFRSHAALLAYEPFTNTPGSAIIGSSDGFGFNGAWQANSSGGVATNTAYALSYTDA